MDTKKYKQELLDKLYAPYKKCMECPLANFGRKTIVFGGGNPDAQLMLIGEAPGAEEDERGMPFVGKSGALLNTIFEILNIERSNIFITNIVKCRPPNNRKPYSDEAKTCKNILLINQIKIIRPKIICTLGSAAIQGIIEEEVKITRIRGAKLPFDDNMLIVPTYHPAYILRNPKELDTLVGDIKYAHQLSLQPE
jgi:uracil-DNA glycosylase family 4